MDESELKPAHVDEPVLEAEQKGSREPRPQSSTIGTGSSIGIGCLIAVVLFVVAAFVIRGVFGSW